MQTINIYNLIDLYKIEFSPGNFFCWTHAQDFENQSFDWGDETDPVKMLTDYSSGKCELFDHILVLHKAENFNLVEGDAREFDEELKASPKWLETECFVTGLDTGIPSIRYCKNGNHVPFDYALYVMERQLGYTWNSVIKRFEKEVNNAK